MVSSQPREECTQLNRAHTDLSGSSNELLPAAPPCPKAKGAYNTCKEWVSHQYQISIFPNRT
ncbi:hypothetical protein F511_01001 [Dorcoceras hygrometricum]|uniref:Uncharacterized protein n=1 Tax=Dorcoceras hygrometricum TaxID=472368 RepID=A0A2Z7AM06_9LAMI|nr:hypothetical protein F511_01001 [Dorcoceras hygrometricum]